jgi:hypothetical protein
MHNLIPFWILDYGIWILDCVPPKGGPECNHAHALAFANASASPTERIIGNHF